MLLHPCAGPIEHHPFVANPKKELLGELFVLAPDSLDDSCSQMESLRNARLRDAHFQPVHHVKMADTLLDLPFDLRRKFTGWTYSYNDWLPPF